MSLQLTNWQLAHRVLVFILNLTMCQGGYDEDDSLTLEKGVDVATKPNLFSIATKELSQDAFIAWLLQWGDERYKNADSELHSIGQRFVRFLINLQFGLDCYEVHKVEVWRQWSNIDIWVEVNDEICIIIEDKTGTSEHDDQLGRYSKLVRDYYANKGIWKVAFVYLKTSLEDVNIVKEVEQKGWSYCSRTAFLSFLLSSKTSNDIYNEFTEALEEKEKESKSLNWGSWEATQGLYCYLQESLGEWSGWRYVANPSGGFLGLYFHWKGLKSDNNVEYYLQIENNCYDVCRLVIKITGSWNGTTGYLYDRLGYLQAESDKYGLSVSKPARYRVGEYTTLAIIDDAFKFENDKVDVPHLLKAIRSAMALVDDIAENS